MSAFRRPVSCFLSPWLAYLFGSERFPQGAGLMYIYHLYGRLFAYTRLKHLPGYQPIARSRIALTDPTTPASAGWALDSSSPRTSLLP